MFGMMFDGRFFFEMSLYFFPFGKLGIGNFFFWIIFVENHAFFCCQSSLIFLKVFGSQLDEHSPGLGSGLSQGRTEILGATGSERPAVIGTEIGVSHDHVNAIQGHIQLLCQHLGQRGVDALSHLDFAGKTGNAAVLSDPKIGIEIFGISAAPPSFLEGKGIAC